MLRNKRLSCGQTSPSFTVPVRKVRLSVVCLLVSAPSLMGGLMGSAGYQCFSTRTS